MSLPIVGTLEQVARIKSHEFCADIRSPDGRYRAVRSGLTLQILDTEPDAPVVVGKVPRIFGHQYLLALHPDGQRLAVRNPRRHTLEIRRGKQSLADIITDTVRLTWDGKPVAPDDPRPQWGYADEHLAFTADGAFVVLASQDADGAVVYLLSSETLALVHAFRDLRCYSPYAVTAGQAFSRPSHFAESWLAPQPLAPETFLGVLNAGDSCMGVFALEVRDRQLVSVAPEAFSNAVFDIDSYALRGLRRLRDGVLVITRDYELGRVPWPPEATKRRQTAGAFPAAILNQSDNPLPFATPSYLECDDQVSDIADNRLLIAIWAPDQERTVALLVLDADTFETVGVTPMPRSRARIQPARLLPGGLVGIQSSRYTALYRFR